MIICVSVCARARVPMCEAREEPWMSSSGGESDWPKAHQLGEIGWSVSSKEPSVSASPEGDYKYVSPHLTFLYGFWELNSGLCWTN